MENHGEAEGGRSVAGQPLSLEAENEKLKAEIAFLQKKLHLVGSITRHDVLNQMTAIVGYNELLEMVIEDEKQRSFLDRERQAVNKIRRQFQFAKDYQNIAVDPPRWQNLANAVSRVKEGFDKQTIRFTVPPGTVAVFADPLFDRALHQVFDNSVCHAGVPTEIRLTLQDEGSSARLIIEDDGAGIPAKDKERIFERGYGKGTGWGLFLTREILAITGITIIENGEPGKGARFVLSLPAGTYRSGDGEEPAPPASS
ncbi:MAG: HAMP domain-containing histidine kinase [Methanoregula sp.]|nr:HAMP domain-containing histidine kinase [Methanoregula sp.]